MEENFDESPVESLQRKVRSTDDDVRTDESMFRTAGLKALVHINEYNRGKFEMSLEQYLLENSGLTGDELKIVMSEYNKTFKKDVD